MSSCLFSQHFWGEKHSGFDAMYQNFKLCYRTSSEFAEFLRESYTAEDNYYKTLVKLSKQAGSYNNTSSFKPCWSLLKQFIDQISQVHLTIAQERQNLSRDVQKYLEEQHKRQKLIKDTEASTQEVVHAFQVTSVQLQKAKEAYHSRYNEYERSMRLESGSNRDQEKLEVKLKKAQDEYKYSVEKYNNLRNQFVSKMHISCAQFEEIEVAHLEQMKEFLHRYASVWSITGDALGKLHNQFDRDLTELTTDRLLNILVTERGTGTSEPQGVQFEDAEVAAAFSSNATERANGITANGVRALEAFFAREARAASALAIVGSGTKDNGESSLNSLTDVRSDAVSVTSISVGVVPSVTNISISGNGTAKRREGFFRRRRNSLSQDPAPAIGDNNATGSSTSVGAAIGTNTNIQASGSISLSAFTVVAKRGIRRLGTPYSNGKDKPIKQMDKSDNITSKSDDWRTTTPVELPKDEDGYNIRPPDPWGENSSNFNHSEADDSGSEEDLESKANKTFHGLKVNIRPVGEFAPGVALKYNGDKLESRPKPVETRSPKSTGNSQVPLLIDHRVGSTLRSPRSSISSYQNIPITSGSDSVSNHDLINALPLPPLLPPPPPPPSSSVSSSTTESFTSIGAGGSMRTRNVGLSSFNTLSKGHSISAIRPRGYSCNTWTKKGNSSQLNSAKSLESKDETKNATFSLSSFETLFTVQETNTKDIQSNNSKDSVQKDCSSDFKFGFKDSDSCNSLIDTLQRISSSAMGVNLSPVKNDGDGGLVRRCSSTAPTSMDNESIDQSNWMAFETNSTETSKSFSPSVPWPSFNANIHGTVVGKEARPIPEPPTRLHNHPNNSSIIEPCITPSPSTYSINSPNNSICLAAAFTEIWHARFFNGGGSSFSTAASTGQPPIQAINGSLTLAFPRVDMGQRLFNKLLIPPLVFRITNAERLKDLQPKLSGSSISLFSESTTPTADKPQPILLENLADNNATQIINSCNNNSSDYMLAIPGDVLSSYLAPLIIAHSDENSFSCSDTSDKLNTSFTSNTPTYVKLDVLTYTVDVNADVKGYYPSLTPPIHLCTYWRCEASTTDFRLDYTAQWPTPTTAKELVKNTGDLRINLMIDGTVSHMQSLPVGTWLPEVNHATWRIPLHNTNIDRNLSRDNNSNSAHRSEFTSKFDATGTVRAKFTLTNGPGKPQPVSLQFYREGSLASGVQLFVISSDYRMNLCKYRLIGDRYICDPPTNVNRFHSNSTLHLEQNNNNTIFNSLVITENKNIKNKNDDINEHKINPTSLSSITDT
ncbi:putative proline-serine-threonine phosphatase interacting protein [Schistosoma mansoni]|uniref:Putative proline-serine-threonine phosphatase interacting protein n=1 Tax=Schistosoma mansoni TaxID=6183 RepID=G4V620_SCHMA|nr:putative proline-serine-threonine phosphatase interacting protein [Schistosoma mansoni]|eukprot:XP_018648575.1 putative proline-serine-threonine phosphatase interacting protein [Schistosoma mansoni]